MTPDIYLNKIIGGNNCIVHENKVVYERPMTMGYHYKSRGNLGYAISDPPDILFPKISKIKTDIHDPNSIKFYDDDTPYYEFTNFYEGAPFKVKGVEFKTPEHYYQWQKFNDPIARSRIVNAPTARIASDIAEQNKHLVILNFVKDTAMLNALREKFSRYRDLGKLLVSTSDRQLILHNMYDDYWSDGGDGSGSNKFGRLLMQIRNELRSGILSYI
jgi:ribA/ribD-fused uncharacterized protein